MAKPRAPRESRGLKASGATPRKRSLTPDATPLRQSKRPTRQASAKSTPQQSIYREVDSDGSGAESESEPDVVKKKSRNYSDDESVAAYEETEEDDSVDPQEDSEEDEEFDSSEDEKRKARPGKAKSKAKPKNGSASKSTSKDLWREGVKVQGDGEVFIALPRARSPGKTPYRDNTLHPNTFLFLGDLKKNNEREWLKLHDKDFRQSEKDWKSFVEVLTERLIEKDETIPELPFKDVVFRIYRDVRFSPDPTPYKPHFSAAFSRTGRKGPYAGYYIQVSPGSSFIGGGIWCPEADRLSLLRQALDRRPQRLKDVLLDASIRKEFFGGIAKDKKTAVKSFCKQNTENALKRCPKGYDESHPEIDLLRLRNFTIGRKLKDTEVLGPKGMDNIVDLFATLTPFVTYLNHVVMPDPGDADSDEDGAEESAEE